MDEQTFTTPIIQHVLSYSFGGLLIFHSAMPVMGATLIPATSDTQIDKAGNGVPVVNIAPPNQAGISHNQYQDFNVGKEGLILNNATDRLTATQLGGLIQNNPNLKPRHEASGIINEVIGANRSDLQGFIEVAGQPASVMVANAYGITCDGCGFINIPQATLTTGTPIFDTTGMLEALEVTKGQLTIDGKGLNASLSDKVNLIARATEINAQIHAQDLNIITGHNRIGADNTITAIPGEGRIPVLAIDTRALGGMYANRIKLVSSERGVGVNLGNLNAHQQDISLDSQGKITLKNTLTAGGLKVNAVQALLSGEHKASENLQVNTQQGLALNQAALISGSTISLTSNGTLSIDEAGTDTSRTVVPQGQLELHTEKWKDSTLCAHRPAINVSQNLRPDNPSTLIAREQVSLEARHISLNGSVSSGKDIAITSRQLNTHPQCVLSAKRNLNIKVENNARLHGRAYAGLDLQLSAGELLQTGILAAKRHHTIHTPSLDNQGQLNASGSLTLQGGNLTNQGHILSDASLFISAENMINAGLLSSQQKFSLELQQVLDIPSSGKLLTDGAMTLCAKNIRNSGVISGIQSLDINSDNIQTEAGANLLSYGGLKLNSQIMLLAGLTSSQGEMVIKSPYLTTHPSARIQSAEKMRVNIARRAVLTGEMLSSDMLDIRAGDLIHRGQIQANSVRVHSDKLENSGQINSLGDMALSSASLNQTGSLVASGQASIAADNINNKGLFAAHTFNIKVNNRFKNSERALINAENETNLQSAVFNNSGKVTADKLLISGYCINNNGLLRGVGKLDLVAQSLNNWQQGELYSPHSFAFAIPTLVNMGLMASTNDIALSGVSLANVGKIHAANIILGQHSVSNGTEGRLLADNSLTLISHSLTNAGLLSSEVVAITPLIATNTGTLQGNKALTIKGQSIDNMGSMLTQGQLRLDSQSTRNTGAFQAGQVDIKTEELTNSGTVLGAADLRIQADSIAHLPEGRVMSGGDLTLSSQSLDAQGSITALGDIILTLANPFINQNVLAAGKQLAVQSQGNVLNHNIMQGQGIRVNAGEIFRNQGQITFGTERGEFDAQQIVLEAESSLQGGSDIVLNSRDDIHVQGFTGTLGSLVLSAVNRVINRALLYASQDIYLYADRIKNQQGNILAGNHLRLQKDATGKVNTEITNTSGTIETQHGDIVLATQQLTNERKALNVSHGHPTDVKVKYPWLNGTVAKIPLSELVLGVDYGYYTGSMSYGGGSPGHGATCISTYVAATALKSSPRKEFVLSQSQLSVTAEGGAGRISAAQNVWINASTLNNQASSILAGKNQSITSETFNNQSYTAGTLTHSQSYAAPKPSRSSGIKTVRPQHSSRLDEHDLSYVATGEIKEVLTNSTPYRAVIEASGDIVLNVARRTGNTSTQANTGKSNTATLMAPALNSISQPQVSLVTEEKSLVATALATETPDWDDQLQEILQSLSGGIMELDKGTAHQADIYAYPVPSVELDSFFIPESDPQHPFLIVTNPKLNGLGQLDYRFFNELKMSLGIQPNPPPQETQRIWTDEQQFYGSAYFMNRLNMHPDHDYRFLGDSAFDTRYISNQLINQTGSRYLNGMGSDLAQMQYLIDNAVTARQALNLDFGIGLNASQIAALDGSIIWWESRMLKGQTVMIPKLYLSAKDAEVRNGSVIAGNQVTVLGGDISNDGSTLLAQHDLNVHSKQTADNLNSGLLSAANHLSLRAAGNITHVGSSIRGGTVQLESVDGSINHLTATKDWSVRGASINNQILSFTHTQAGAMASIEALDRLSLNAGKDLSFNNTTLAAGGDLQMKAGGNIRLAGKTHSHRYQRSAGWIKSALSHWNQSYLGTRVNVGGKMQLQAGNDICAEAAELVAGGNIALQAGRDISLLAQASKTGDSNQSSEKITINERVRQQGTAIASGSHIALNARRDINAQAANLAALENIWVSGGGDIKLTPARESDYSYREKTETSGGFFRSTTTHTIEEDNTTRAKGAVISGNNVTVQAGNDLLLQGSVVAGDGYVTLNAANNIDIVAATNSDKVWRFKETHKSGLIGTGGIGFTLGSQTTTHNQREQGTSQSESFSTVGSTAGNTTLTAGQQVHLGGADIITQQGMTVQGGTVVIEPGHNKRTYNGTYESESTGLTIALSGTVGQAINNTLHATQEAIKESDGRLASLKTTKAALSGVQTAQAINIAKSNGSVAQGLGVSVSLTMQNAKSAQYLRSDAVIPSTINAGHHLAVMATGRGQNKAKGDIWIGGSQLKVGGNTRLTAAQDIVLHGAASTQKSTGENSSSGGGVGVSLGGGAQGGGLTVFAHINAAKGHEQGNDTRWTETTLDSGGTTSITSGRDVILKGAQISSNKFIANTAGDWRMSSQQNSNHFHSKQEGVAAGGSFTFGSMTGSGYLSASQDKMRSTYDSVLAQTGIYAGEGGFDLRVSRHTQLDGAVIASQANGRYNRLDTGTLGFKDIDNQADFSVSHSGISLSASGEFGKDPFKGNMSVGMISADQHGGHAAGTTQAAMAPGAIIIRNTADQKQSVVRLSRDPEHANVGSLSPIFNKNNEQKRLQTLALISEIGSQVIDVFRTQGEINALAIAREKHPNSRAEELKKTAIYREEQAKYGTGSDIQRAIQATTAVLQGVAGGNLTGALAGASAPILANIIGHHAGFDNNPKAKITAHALLGGAVAMMQGNSAVAGAAGAASAELTAQAMMTRLYPDKSAHELSEPEKQTITLLSSLSAGITGGITGNSTFAAATGAQSGKNTVENNALSGVLAAAEANKKGTIEKYEAGTQAAIKEACSGGTPISCELAVAAMGSAMAWPLLPAAAATTSIIGAGANAGVGYLINGEVTLSDVILGYWTGALTAGTGLWGTVAVNAGSGATSSWLKGDDPLKGGAISGAASGLGYGVGKLVELPFDKVFNPMKPWKDWIWTDVGMGISKPLPINPVPGMTGNASGSAATEIFNDQAGKAEAKYKKGTNDE